MSKIHELHQQKSRLLSEASEMTTRGIVTQQQKTAFNRITSQLDDVQFDIDAIERIERTLPKTSPAPAPTPVATPAMNDRTSKRHKKHLINRAWRQYLATGRTEQRDLLTISDADGAALIPQEYEKNWVDALKWYGPIATLVSNSDQDSGRPLKRAVSNDTSSSMTLLSESGSTSALEEDPTLFSQIQGVDTLTTVIKYSFQEFEDSASPLEDFINKLAGIRVARAIETAITLGTDNSSSSNVLPNSATGGLLGSGLSAGVTMSSGTLTSGPTYANLVALKGSVDFAYQVNGAFMTSPTTHTFLEAQIDSTGRPLYKHDPNTGLLQVAGKPVYVNNALPSYSTASSKAVLFGDFSRAYWFVNAGMRIKILAERYADVLERAAIIYTRVSGAPLVSGALKALVTASS